MEIRTASGDLSHASHLQAIFTTRSKTLCRESTATLGSSTELARILTLILAICLGLSLHSDLKLTSLKPRSVQSLRGHTLVQVSGHEPSKSDEEVGAVECVGVGPHELALTVVVPAGDAVHGGVVVQHPSGVEIPKKVRGKYPNDDI